MGYGPRQEFYGHIASGASTCTSVDLGTKAFSKVFLEVATCSTNSVITIFGSNDNAQFRVVNERVNTASMQYQSLTVQTAAANSYVPLDAPFRYLQFRTAEVVSGGVSLTIHCLD